MRVLADLRQQGQHRIFVERERTALETQYAVGQTGALRHSGAMSLLSPWKLRRAGAV